jgi:hypothetical protein
MYMCWYAPDLAGNVWRLRGESGSVRAFPSRRACVDALVASTAAYNASQARGPEESRVDSAPSATARENVSDDDRPIMPEAKTQTKASPSSEARSSKVDVVAPHPPRPAGVRPGGKLATTGRKRARRDEKEDAPKAKKMRAVAMASGAAASTRILRARGSPEPTPEVGAAVNAELEVIEQVYELFSGVATIQVKDGRRGWHLKSLLRKLMSRTNPDGLQDTKDAIKCRAQRMRAAMKEYKEDADADGAGEWVRAKPAHKNGVGEPYLLDPVAFLIYVSSIRGGWPSLRSVARDALQQRFAPTEAGRIASTQMRRIVARLWDGHATPRPLTQ